MGNFDELGNIGGDATSVTEELLALELASCEATALSFFWENPDLLWDWEAWSA